MRILLTTCSFQDTPGPHHQLLAAQGYEVVCERGPLSEARMLELAGDFDAFLCGDDTITRAVLDRSGPRLKVISKYGIGLDKIDLAATKEKKSHWTRAHWSRSDHPRESLRHGSSRARKFLAD